MTTAQLSSSFACMELIGAIGTGLSIGNGARTAAQTAAQISRGALRRLRLSALADPHWISGGPNDVTFGMTAEDIGNSEAFLQSPGAAPILGFVALTKVTPASPERDEILRTLQRAFGNEAQRWALLTNNGLRNVPRLWDMILAIYEGTLPSKEALDDVQADIQSFSEFVNTPLNFGIFGDKAGTEYDDAADDADNEEDSTDDENGDSTEAAIETADRAAKGKVPIPPSRKSYLRRLRNLAQNIDGIVKTAVLSKNLCELILATGHGPLISHFQISGDLKFADVYVGRVVEDRNGRRLSSEEAIEARGTFRIVLRGSPGIGKSTYISHLVHLLSDPTRRQSTLPSVVIRCRNYSRDAWNKPLTEYMSSVIAANFSTTITLGEIEDLLLTGQLAVVVDGLDEIAHSAQRAEMLQRIQALVVQYPVMSILVTARDVGYEQVSLSPNLFTHLRLLEFNESELAQYCHRWFTAVDRPELIESFIAESAAINDLRTNPLILSLLCNLYSGSGYIPTNRRDAYAQCANLLFHTWDANRQIRHNEIMPSYGNRLMAEIARIFYTSSESDNGRLDEQVVRRAVARYLVKNVAFAYEDAEPAARDFINFCAGRAWFLKRSGEDGFGSTLVEFTHRTFFEFFAAESLASKPAIGDTSEERSLSIAKIIMDLYGRDRSTVLPELLIQAYDARNELGASQVLAYLCELNAFTLLLLRLMNGAIFSSESLIIAFDLITVRWNSKENEVDRLQLTALFGIHPIARRFFVQRYLRTNSADSWHVRMADAWASMTLSGIQTDNLSVWSSEFHSLIERFGSVWETQRCASLTNEMLLLGYSPRQLSFPWKYLACSGVAGRTPGAVWWAISSRYSEGPGSLAALPSLGRAVRDVHSRLTSDGWIPAYVLDALRGPLVEIGRIGSVAPWLTDESDAVSDMLLDILFTVVLAVGESSRDYDATIASISEVLPGSVLSILLAKRRSDGDATAGDAEDQLVASSMLDRMPRFIANWFYGSRRDLSH